MKNRLFVAALGAFLLMSGARGFAADAPETKGESKAQARADLQVLVAKIQKGIGEGKRTEEALAEELKEFDALLAKHKDEKTDDVAQILLMKATLYMEIIKNMDKAAALVEQLKKDFPETSQGKKADDIIASIKAKQAMAVGAAFPNFEEKDLEGKPYSVASYKGKVVLVDFWATWCGPCVRELPNVLKTYEKYHAKGFEIVGISLDSDKAKLTSFIADQKMGWRQYFDGKGWQNKLAGKYGISSIPATFLLDSEGKIIARDLRGDDLETEVGKALEKH